MAPDPPASHPLAAARLAIEHGNYGQVLRDLAALEEQYPATSQVGGELQLLMATAWMGQGEVDRAIACCRRLRGCVDGTLRAQAQDLLLVLEAPALQRPREWSLTLPALGEAEPLAGRVRGRGQRRRPDPGAEPPPPPVGPTRAPLGFALVVLAVLTALALLLGGCGPVRAELHFHGPGRLQVGFQPGQGAGPATPWQRQFSAALRQQGFSASRQAGPGPTGWRSPVLPAGEALGLLAHNLQEAGRLAGVALPPADLNLEERNWLVGVRQRLALNLDLTALEPLPGVDVALELSPLGPGAVRAALPEPAVAAGPDQPQTVVWPLRLGARNALELRCWRWSPLGLGALAVALALVLVSLLARLRRALGFGLPELPA